MPQLPDYFERDWHGLRIYGRRIASQDVLHPEDRPIIAEGERRGLIFGECYSVVCPGGELGTTPGAEVRAISKEEFEDARARGWR